ncbi:MAG: Helicase [uncultured Sulfurovum sp.]|uniref:Helicase n=1 Tax=uncultured Sulfurovum sp. TaxID=269237 RepID=A0A6S6U3Y8_9BACT|nr:MAG: Helicase [uncultured Sulfurovum sp.]
MFEQTDTPKEKIYYDQRSVTLRTTQSLYFVQEHDKTILLGLLLNEHKEKQIVIVVKSKKKADALSEFLISKEFKALAVHGNHREVQQKEAGTAFNLGTLNIIITTNMILKTLELENIKLLVSYDLPETPVDYYTHLASMKELGEAFALVSPEDEPLLGDIEFNMKKEIEEKILEEFVPSSAPSNKGKAKKDRQKKPRHRKVKARKEKEA